jgi:hypothetical protein
MSIEHYNKWKNKVKAKLSQKELKELDVILSDLLSTKKSNPQYIRHGIYGIHEVLPYLVDPKTVHDLRKFLKSSDPLLKLSTEKCYDGKWVKMSSTRYHTFKKSLTCAKCGLKANFFALEQSPKQDRCHFNLYGINTNGREILFTQDHIIPKSKGGHPTNLNNLQTMCTHCNALKNDSKEEGD